MNSAHVSHQKTPVVSMEDGTGSDMDGSAAAPRQRWREMLGYTSDNGVDSGDSEVEQPVAGPSRAPTADRPRAQYLPAPTAEERISVAASRITDTALEAEIIRVTGEIIAELREEIRNLKKQLAEQEPKTPGLKQRIRVSGKMQPIIRFEDLFIC
jgi:hypothetical protein